MKIMLDSGHKGLQNRSPVLPEYYESSRMWALTQMLGEELALFGFEVGFTRSSVDTDLSVTQRGKKAVGCDLFLSLHSNAVSDRSVDRVEVFAPLDGKNGSFELGRQIAEAVRDTLAVSAAAVKTKRSSDGVNEYYGVLRGAASVGCPRYFIVEHGFHTHKPTAEWLMKDENLTLLARSEAEAIATYFGVKRPFLLGDVNGDGRVDARDYALLKRAVLGSVTLDGDAKRAADINGDGKINSADYALLKRTVLGN